MYATAQYYKNNLRSGYLKSKIVGTLSSGSQTFNISEKDILQGSFTITNQCTNGDDFNYGGVYAGELHMTLYGINATRFSLRNAQLTLTYIADCGNNNMQTIPLGTWNVAEAKRSKKTIALTCYDNMLKLDNEFGTDAEGTAYELISAACSACGVVLGTSSSAISAMPNSNITLTAKADDIDTYRTLLGYVCALLGAFATIGRDGHLYIKQFNTTSIATIDESQRVSTTVNDYTTFYGQVKGEFPDDEGKYSKVYVTSGSGGLSINLGKNPLVVGEQSDHMRAVGNLMNAAAGLRYVPAQASIIPDPSYDLGDTVTLTNLEQTTDTSIFLLTKFNWVYHGSCTLTSNGSDPARAAVSSSTKKSEKQESKDAAAKASGGDWIIIAANKLSDTQFTTTATNGKRNVTNTWNISETSTKTTFTNVTAGYDIEFTGW